MKASTTRNMAIKARLEAKRAEMESIKNMMDLEHSGPMNIHYLNQKPYSEYGNVEHGKIYKRGNSKRVETARLKRDGI